MLTRATLQRINNRPKKVSRLPLMAVGGGTLLLAALLYVLLNNPTFALAVILAGVLGVLVIYRTQKAKTTISLSYKGNLSEETSTRFSEVQEALEALASSEKVWRLDNAARLRKRAEVTPTPEREPVRVGLLPTPGIRADVPIWGIETGEESIFFFPEGGLYYRDDRYEPFSYKLFKVRLSSVRSFEEEELPEDANVVENTWRFSRPDGSPDPRYKKDNVQIPVVLYSVLEISASAWFKMRLVVSSRQAAIRFATAFGAEDPRNARRESKSTRWTSVSSEEKPSSSKQREKTSYRSAEGIQRETLLASARKTLGIAKGASPQEISAAYRKLARTHHPDKVANLEPGVREYSEQRMKEINAAYALLRRQGTDPTVEGVG